MHLKQQILLLDCTSVKNTVFPLSFSLENLLIFKLRLASLARWCAVLALGTDTRSSTSKTGWPKCATTATPSSGKEVNFCSCLSVHPVLVVTDPSCRGQCVRAVQQLQPADAPCQPPSLGCLPESATTQFVEEQEKQLVSQPGEPHLFGKPVKHDPTHTNTYVILFLCIR